MEEVTSSNALKGGEENRHRLAPLLRQQTKGSELDNVSTARLYRRTRAKENHARFFLVLRVLLAFTFPLVVLLGIFDPSSGNFFPLLLISLVLMMSIPVFQTAFGRAHLEEFGTAVATVCLTALVVASHNAYSYAGLNTAVFGSSVKL